MYTYLVVFGFLLVAFSLMILMLQFSKYKQRNHGCCSDGIEEGMHGKNLGASKDSCFTCPHKDLKDCDSREKVEALEI